MLHASWKSLLGRKLRLAMSAFAIVLGVAFVSGSFIFTDTLGKAFDGITEVVGDVVVRPATASSDFDSALTAKTVPASLVRELASVDGAARADGNVSDPSTFVVSKQGKLIGGGGPPGLGLSHNDAPTGSGKPPVSLVDGRWPERSGEVNLDEGTAERAGYRIGDTVTLVTSGARPKVEATLVGTSKFSDGGLVGATLAFFETRTAQQLYFDGKDEFTDAWVTARPGVDPADLAKAVQAQLPTGYQAVTGASVAKEQANGIGQALGFINTFLLIFAGIALFVGAFLIINTFSILVAQRSRELALLRALGAARRQVSRSVLFEAFVVAVFGSTVGLGLGFVLAIGIRSLFATFGLDLSGTPLVLEPRTAVAAYLVGLVVTLVAAYLPARRAGKMPPVAAMRDDIALPESSLVWRTALGGAGIVLGLEGIVLGVFLTNLEHRSWWVGGGVGLLILGAITASPVLARPLIVALGAVYRGMFRTVGLMAEQNAVRNPRRTAATASALMIGLTLVSMMSVFGASAKASVDKTIGENFAADYVVSSAIGQPFSAAITKDVAAVPGVAEVASMRYTAVTIDGDRSFSGAIDPAVFPKVVPLDLTSGTFAGAKVNSLFVDDGKAAELGASVGDTVRAAVAGGKPSPYVLAGVYKRQTLAPPVMITQQAATKAGAPQQDSLTMVLRTPTADAKSVEAGINRVIADLPTVSVKDQDAFAAEQRKPIDQLLFIIYALLGLAVLIAILGIVNTLALSVIERTREIGLLRAVGLSRRQLRTMLRLESVAIALVGAVLGVVLGVGAGWALQRTLADDGIDVLSIPVPQLALFVVLAGVVGVLAALWPGRRAARLDILRAITTD